MHYFELKLNNPENENEFLDIKGTTNFLWQSEIESEYVPEVCKYWSVSHFKLMTAVTTEDILRHQLKTAL